MKTCRVRSELIFIYLKTTDISKTAFCRKCKISPKTLDLILKGQTPKNLLTIAKIAEGMGLRRHNLLELED